MVMRDRAGRTVLGCLLTVVLLVAVGYVAINAAEIYWRYYAFRDAMSQEARFAANSTDTAIRDHLRARADSLGLPDAAQTILIQRARREIFIGAEYTEVLKMPLMSRDLHLSPQVVRPY